LVAIAQKGQKMANFTITWRGKSGTSYTFDCFPGNQAFNPVSGVYILCRNIPGGGWEALYVGETGSFKDRLNVGQSLHDGYQRAKAAGATHIAAMLVSGDTERLRIETDLRHGLNPSCNAQNANALSGFGFRR
jgi:hypothetical protein